MSQVILWDGRTLNTHDPDACAADEFCCIHKPSDHPLKDAPYNWRTAGPFDIKPSHMERMCPHGVGHPDPDALAFMERQGITHMGVHGCDGCCL